KYPWVSMGDRNLIKIPNSIDPENVYKVFIDGCHDIRDTDDHYGSSTTWLGFTYDKFLNPIVKNDFSKNDVLDLMISNVKSNRSFHHPGVYDLKTNTLVDLSKGVSEELNDMRY